jgi:hypothetical protein
MELKEFIKETLVEILNGVSEAQAELTTIEAEINPRRKFGKEERERTSMSEHHCPVYDVDFDIAVTVTEGQEAKARIAVFTGIFGSGVGADIKSANVSQNRIKFRVPISYPQKKAVNG